MKIPFGKPLIGKEEQDAVTEVLSGPILVHGPRATAFEETFKDFTNAPYAVSVSSLRQDAPHLFSNWFGNWR